MSTREGLRAAPILASLGWLLVGCGSGGLPETHYYTLRPPVEAQSALDTSSDEGLAIGVESFAVDPPYDQDRIVYRRGVEATQVGFYYYHRWAAPVGRLIQNAFVEGLRGVPGVRSIEPANSAADYGARLGGRVLYLEHIDRPSSQDVRVAMELELRDEKGSLWSATLTATKRGDVVLASDAATLLAELVDELVIDARRELAAALSSE